MERTTVEDVEILDDIGLLKEACAEQGISPTPERANLLIVGGKAMKRILVRPQGVKVVDNARSIVTGAINTIHAAGGNDFSERSIFKTLTDTYGDVLNNKLIYNIRSAISAIKKGAGAIVR